MKKNGSSGPHDVYADSLEGHSGSHNIATIREAVVIAEEAVAKTAWHTRIQWGVVGAFILGAGTFISWSLNKLDIVNVAMAQAQAQGAANTEQINRNSTRIEAVDAGTRAAVERLERKIDASEERTAKKLDDVQLTMQQVLKEMRRK